jgi:hypothetical protein
MVRLNFLPPNQFAVCDVLRRIVSRADHAVLDREPIDRHAEVIGGQRDERLARRCARLREVGVAKVRWMRLLTRCRTLIRRDLGITLHQANPSKGDRQFFRDELRCAVKRPVPSSHFPVQAVTHPSAAMASHPSSWGLPVPLKPCAKADSASSNPSPTRNATISTPARFKKRRRDNPACASARRASGIIKGFIRSSPRIA